MNGTSRVEEADPTVEAATPASLARRAQSAWCVGIGLCLAAVVGNVVTGMQVAAATRHRPVKDHRWQVATSADGPAAVALPCATCAPDLVLRCLEPGRGILRLSLPGAVVANGRDGAAKQLRLAVDGTRERRRAITRQGGHWRARGGGRRGFTPTIDLASDDRLLSRLADGRLLQVDFYGQRSFVGLRGAAGPLETILKRCRPPDQAAVGRHCTWVVVFGCSTVRTNAARLAGEVPHGFVRAGDGGYCAVVAHQDLASARNIAAHVAGYVERSCLY